MEKEYYGYNDGLCNAGRMPRLYLAKGSEFRKFRGENIPEWCAIATAKYTKSGKWSNTAYQLDLAPGVRALHFLSPMHRVWGDDCATWGEIAERLGLPVDAVRALIRAEYVRTADRLDRLEAFALAVEAEGHETETVVVSFGSPTRRQRSDGFWETPKSSQTSDGRTVTVSKGSMSADAAERRAREWGVKCGYAADSDEVAEFRGRLTADVGWEHPAVVEPEGAKILSSRHAPGMGGGYWTIEVVVPVAAS